MNVKILVSILCFLLFVGGVVFLTSCEKEQTNAPTAQHNNIDPRIVEMVQQATNDKVLQQQMIEEVQYLIDTNSAKIETICIEYDELMKEFEYIYNGDQAAGRSWIRRDVDAQKKNSEPISVRTHRRAPYFVNDATYTIYVHTAVPSAWVTAVTQAFGAWNALGVCCIINTI